MNNPIVRRITATLFASQSLAQVALTAALTVGPIAAKRISGSPSLAGLPTTILLLGTAAAAYPAGRFMDRFGRRNGLGLGFASSLIGGAISALALIVNSFIFLLIGFALMGFGRGAIDQGRFAAAEVVPPEGRARAVSWFVLGGTVGGIGGPLVVGPMGRLVAQFNLPELSGPYLAAAALFLVGRLVIFILLRPDPRDIARQIAVEAQGAERRLADSPARSFGEIIRVRRAQVAMAAMILGQFVMVSVMVITPLHMTDHQQSLDAVSWVIAAHVFGMFALSVVSGRVADTYGRGTAIAVGSLVLLASCILAPLAQTPLTLGLALFLLGMGWNFCYVAGSSLLADVLRPSERGRVQGTNDLIVGLTSASGSLGSGLIFGAVGYAAIAVVGMGLALSLLTFSAFLGRPHLAESASMD
ncbi:MAG: MFS transporter [Chloroflexi bacterium]|nr:MFS transporter [Chloroflexota bacterium]